MNLVFYLCFGYLGYKVERRPYTTAACVATALPISSRPKDIPAHPRTVPFLGHGTFFTYSVVPGKAVKVLPGKYSCRDWIHGLFSIY